MKKILALVLAILCCLPLCLLASADGAPSVQKEEIVLKKAVVTDEDGQSTEIDLGSIVITHYAQRENANEEIKEKLVDANNQIEANLDDLGLISEEMKEGLKEAAAVLNKHYNSTVFVATELFDVEVPAAVLKVLQDSPNSYIDLTFTVTYTDDLTAAHKKASDNTWEVISHENIKDNGDGTVTIRFSELCPVVFLHTNEEVATELVKEGKAQTARIVILIVIAVILVALIVFFLLFAAKKKKEKREETVNEEKKD